MQKQVSVSVLVLLFLGLIAARAQAAKLCGSDLPDRLESVRRSVEKYYSAPIKCEMSESPESALVNGKPVLHMLPPNAPGRDTITYHELMHMQLWTEGFPGRTTVSCPKSGSAPNLRMEQFCALLAETIVHRLINQRLDELMLRTDRDVVDQTVLHQIDEILRDRKLPKDPDLARNARELVETKYRCTSPVYQRMRSAFIQTGHAKTVELAEKLEFKIDADNPRTPSEARTTLSRCLGIVTTSHIEA